MPNGANSKMSAGYVIARTIETPHIATDQTEEATMRCGGVVDAIYLQECSNRGNEWKREKPSQPVGGYHES